jgi:hypothetical protein
MQTSAHNRPAILPTCALLRPAIHCGIPSTASSLCDLFPQFRQTNRGRTPFRLFGFSEAAEIFIFFQLLLKLEEFPVGENGILFYAVLLDNLWVQGYHHKSGWSGHFSRPPQS